jgi:hypothetical protein
MLLNSALPAQLKYACRHVVIAICLIAGMLFQSGGRHLAEAADAVNCADIAMRFDDKGFEVSCETGSEMLAGMNGTMESQHLEATASDSSSFVDAFHYSLNGQVIYTATDLRHNFETLYQRLSLRDWHSGRAVSTLSTAEFKADMRGLPSSCVAFQKLGHHDWGGYKKIMIGVACSQDNIDQAYIALNHLYLPN